MAQGAPPSGTPRSGTPLAGTPPTVTAPRSGGRGSPRRPRSGPRPWPRAPTTAWPWSSPGPGPGSARPSPRSSPASAHPSWWRRASPSTSRPGSTAIESIGAPVVAVTCDIRDPEAVAAAFESATDVFGLPGVLVNNAAANFPVPAEDMSPNAWRTVVDITLNGTFLCAREFARRHLVDRDPGLDPQHRCVLRVDRRAGLRPLGGGQGRRGQHDRDAGGRVGSVRHPGQLPGARACSPTRT